MIEGEIVKHARKPWAYGLVALAVLSLANAPLQAADEPANAPAKVAADPATTPPASPPGNDAVNAEQGHSQQPLMNYKGAASSPLVGEEMHQDINPKAPAMTAAEFDKAKLIYFERCA